MEAELNRAKDSLHRSDFNRLRQRTEFEQSLKAVQARLTNQLHAQNVTKAWLKMVDLLFQEIVWGQLNRFSEVKAFMNADLPGAFVFAANHVFKTNQIPFDWVISSYYPQSKEGDFLEDSFGLLAGNPGKSLVGRIITKKGAFWSNGDLTNPRTCDILSQLAISRIGKVNLYTADGGFGVEGREDQQENLSIPLIFGEVRVGLQVLEKGGVFILKLFTFFNPILQNCLLWLGRQFQQYTFVKPAASSRLNSEVYFVAVNYQGNGESVPVQIERTDRENLFIQTFLSSFTRNQIESIRAFPKLGPVDEFSYRRLSPISQIDWIQVSSESK